MKFYRSSTCRAVASATAFLACTALVVACTGEPETKPSDFSIGGGSMVKGFTPTPTAAIHKPATGSEHGELGDATSSQPSVAPPPPDGPGAVTISTMGNDLEFDKKTVTVAGGTVSVTFKNNATSASLQHNLVIVKKGSEDAVATAGLSAGPTNDWIPNGDPNVIAQTKLVAGGKSETVAFTAPAPGSYTFLCTFPGHPTSMNGTFEVK